MILITEEEQDSAQQYSALAWELAGSLANATTDYAHYPEHPVILRRFKLIHKESKVVGRTTVDFRHSMVDFLRLHITIFREGTGKIIASSYRDGECMSKEIRFNADRIDISALSDEIKETIGIDRVELEEF